MMSDSGLEHDSKVTLRDGTADDIPVVLKMIRELAEYQKQGQRVIVSAETLKHDAFGAHPVVSCIIAEIDGAPVGMAIFLPTYSTWEGQRGLYINDLFVDTDMRGRGIGHSLIQRLAVIAQERSCTYLALNVVHANPARNFYDRFGFEHVDDFLTYRLRGHQLENLIKS